MATEKPYWPCAIRCQDCGAYQGETESPGGEDVVLVPVLAWQALQRQQSAARALTRILAELRHTYAYPSSPLSRTKLAILIEDGERALSEGPK